ncbi:MAG: transcriptional repressor LexA [Dehalococcoidales bacterium]|jgi:repressor LexA|nr:transcriptional repressor LexA [Dehalococcoidales bacterium]
MDGLSPRQQKILSFIRAFLMERSYPPTIRDIVKGCGISSTSVVDYNLGILEKEGYIRRHRDVSRGIELLRDDIVRKATVSIPVIGHIAAGEPIPVPGSDSWNNSDFIDSLQVPTELLGGKTAVYALKVKGFSMIDALINDGDIVLMQNVKTVENGQMAAVWLKNEKKATLKKVYFSPDKVRLQPANSQMEPIYASPEDVEIQGKVIAVIRQLT